MSELQSSHGLAFEILAASLGEAQAGEIWSAWTVSQRANAASFADTHFRSLLQSAAEELVAWTDRTAE